MGLQGQQGQQAIKMCVFGEEQGQWKLIGIYQSYPPSAHLNAGTLELWFEARFRAILERNSPVYFIPGLYVVPCLCTQVFTLCEV